MKSSRERRQWKLAVIKALTADGLQMASLRRTIGPGTLDDVLREIYVQERNPFLAAPIVKRRLQERFGDLAELSMEPYERRPI
jgi:hypothetical protein